VIGLEWLRFLELRAMGAGLDVPLPPTCPAPPTCPPHKPVVHRKPAKAKVHTLNFIIRTFPQLSRLKNVALGVEAASRVDFSDRRNTDLRQHCDVSNCCARIDEFVSCVKWPRQIADKHLHFARES
jgi:hypothetical protein